MCDFFPRFFFLKMSERLFLSHRMLLLALIGISCQSMFTLFSYALNTNEKNQRNESEFVFNSMQNTIATFFIMHNSSLTFPIDLFTLFKI